MRELIGLTGQYASVDEDLSGTENLVLIGRLLEAAPAGGEGASRGTAGAVRTDRRRRASGQDLLRRHAPAARPGREPGGRPQVLYLDEPTTGLDPHARSEVWEVVRKLVADGLTVLLTTQYLEEADHWPTASPCSTTAAWSPKGARTN